MKRSVCGAGAFLVLYNMGNNDSIYEKGERIDENNNDPDMTKVNGMPHHIRVEIATKIEKRIGKEVGEYDLSKNGEYQKVCREVGDEYGITMTEAACLYFGWDAYRKLQDKA